MVPSRCKRASNEQDGRSGSDTKRPRHYNKSEVWHHVHFEISKYKRLGFDQFDVYINDKKQEPGYWQSGIAKTVGLTAKTSREHDPNPIAPPLPNGCRVEVKAYRSVTNKDAASNCDTNLEHDPGYKATSSPTNPTLDFLFSDPSDEWIDRSHHLQLEPGCSPLLASLVLFQQSNLQEDGDDDYDDLLSMHMDDGEPFRCPVWGCVEMCKYYIGYVHHKQHAHEKPLRCPVIGCEKAYKSMSGLIYHKVHGHRGQQLEENPNGSFSIVDPATSIFNTGPYRCMSCDKRYKNLNGLRYHRQLSPPCNPDLKLNPVAVAQMPNYEDFADSSSIPKPHELRRPSTSNPLSLHGYGLGRWANPDDPEVSLMNRPPHSQDHTPRPSGRCLEPMPMLTSSDGDKFGGSPCSFCATDTSSSSACDTDSFLRYRPAGSRPDHESGQIESPSDKPDSESAFDLWNEYCSMKMKSLSGSSIEALHHKTADSPADFTHGGDDNDPLLRSNLTAGTHLEPTQDMGAAIASRFNVYSITPPSFDPRNPLFRSSYSLSYDAMRSPLHSHRLPSINPPAFMDMNSVASSLNDIVAMR